MELAWARAEKSESCGQKNNNGIAFVEFSLLGKMLPKVNQNKPVDVFVAVQHNGREVRGIGAG